MGNRKVEWSVKPGDHKAEGQKSMKAEKPGYHEAESRKLRRIRNMTPEGPTEKTEDRNG